MAKLVRGDFLEVLQRAQPPLPKTKRIEMRVTEGEEQAFAAAAKISRLTLSEWLRSCAREKAAAQLAGGQRRK